MGRENIVQVFLLCVGVSLLLGVKLDPSKLKDIA